jgi:DNA-binding transcriptional LysR family regulator
MQTSRAVFAAPWLRKEGIRKSRLKILSSGRAGVLRSPADLASHACINWRLQADGRLYRWEFEKRGKLLEVAAGGPLITNDSDIGVEAALQGLGILYAFERARVDECVEQGLLTRILADWSITKPGLFLYYPNRRHAQAALGAFVDCLLDRDLVSHGRAPDDMHPRSPGP